MRRTQAEIVARLHDLEDDDPFGFRAEVLVVQLDYEHARPWLKVATEQEWQERRDRRLIAHQAIAYLEFAWGKARDHRGISAARSVQQLGEYAWLLGRDDIADAMDEAGNENFGVPKLVAFARGLGVPVPEDEELRRMAEGQPCRPGCDEGCGR